MIKSILSINEEYEFQDQLLAKPVKSQDWREKKYVVKQINLGSFIYIHCTGGRGRSVSVASLLLKIAP